MTRSRPRVEGRWKPWLSGKEVEWEEETVEGSRKGGRRELVRASMGVGRLRREGREEGKGELAEIRSDAFLVSLTTLALPQKISFRIILDGMHSDAFSRASGSRLQV